MRRPWQSPMPVDQSPHPSPPLRSAAGASPRRPAGRTRALTSALALAVAALVVLPAAASAAAKLTPQGPKITVLGSSKFGAATAVSADGSTALVGAPGDDSVTVLTRSGASWTATATLGPSDN